MESQSKACCPLSLRCVVSSSEVMQVVGGVLRLRARCPTLVHAHSSRSHLIVTLTISSKSPNALALGEQHLDTLTLVSMFVPSQRCIDPLWSPELMLINTA